MAAGQVGRGSGFFVAAPRPGGGSLLVTCRHVAADRGTLLGVLLADGTRRDVELLAADEAHDLAVLKVEGPAPASLPLSDGEPAAGQRAWAVTRFGVSEATVTGPATDEALGTVVMLSAPGLGPGSSGGAVVDISGRVVAVVWGAEDGDQPRVGAVPAGRVRALLATVPAR